MNLQPDDPRLTAYALGELDETERAEIEQYLEQNEEARAEVELTRAFAQQLTEEFKREDTPALTDLQRHRIQKATAPRHTWRRVMAYAAGLLVVLGVSGLYVEHSMRTFSLGDIIAVADNAKPGSPPPPPASAPQELSDSEGMTEMAPASAAVSEPVASEEAVSADVLTNAPIAQYQQRTTLKIREDSAVSAKKQAVRDEDKTLQRQTRLSAANERASRLSEHDRSSGLQNVSVGGNIQLRGQWHQGKSEPSVKIGDQRLEQGSSCIPITPMPPIHSHPTPNTESYATINENPFAMVTSEPLSTFSIDVDTASYANVRRFLNQGQLPPADAVRIEELINYFKYDYPQPDGEVPFSVNVEVNACPWAPDHMLARIGLRGKVPVMDERPPCNLIFLLDVSGSMSARNKLPLLKRSMAMLANSLAPNDRIGIVVYDNVPRVVLEPTPSSNLGTITCAINSLEANGGTNGADGLRLAYEVARRSFIEGGINRILVGTDGDFNVGTTDHDELIQMIQQQAKSGVFLSVLGFGMGNLKDANLEGLADKGNGNYAYIDTFNEARRVLLEQAASTLITIAKDVKIQVEFNPAKVGAYRLIGYENRALAAQDFNDDRKDAGEIGAGHTVTALYELVPAGQPLPTPNVDPLKYQPNPAQEETAAPPTSSSDELMTVKLRYKQPDGNTSSKIEVPVMASSEGAPSPDYTFAAGVAAFGMILRDSQHKGTATLDMVSDLAQRGKGADRDGSRTEFLGMVSTAQALLP